MQPALRPSTESPVGLLTLLIGRFILRHPATMAQALLPVLLAYAASIVIAAFGMADGGPPKFADAAVVYAISAALIAIFVAIGFNRKANSETLNG